MRDLIKKAATTHRWYIKNRDEVLRKGKIRSKIWFKKNRKHVSLRRKAYRKANPEIIREGDIRELLKLKATTMSHYGKVCHCCKETKLEFLTIDHIGGTGAKHRKRKKVGSGYHFYRWLKKRGYPKGYRVLCFNCNESAFRGGGICVHKRKPAWTTKKVLVEIKDRRFIRNKRR